eukprot:CAMPEP_0184666784 /NCGR_PEP_ID=MMETSP0308-20130426/63751_1 /TAXON_ID=38269 /ORGANISM="Gloeochaete witrockiana, Strain SAG 46.84" /LENGTH=227 /DNA_ID=CAMNT_0027111567 /DNA_START=27 /DNA_END=710 /DNA_ORIENTATION=+
MQPGFGRGAPVGGPGGFGPGPAPMGGGGFGPSNPANFGSGMQPQPANNGLHSFANGISPQEYQQIQQWFNAVDTNRSGQLDVNELHRCLCMGGHQFSVAVTQKILNAFDTDRSGEIGLNEFVAMHKYLLAMRDSFMFFDRDRSNSLDANELFQALQRAGHNISPPALNAALPRFDSDRNKTLSFDEYIDLCIYLGNLRKLYGFYGGNERGFIQLNYDQLVACAPYFQ